MHINLTTPMSDDKERQRQRAAMIDAIEQYTEERMNDENTNGSRSGEQPTQNDALRDLVATLWCASGCSCCRDDDAWEKASHELAELFGIPKYDDGSGYDWYSVCDAAKGQSK